MEKILNGKSVSENIYNNIKNKSVNLSIIIVGDRQDSLIYVNILRQTQEVSDQ